MTPGHSQTLKYTERPSTRATRPRVSASPRPRVGSSPRLRVPASLFLFLLALFLCWHSASTGLARLLATYGSTNDQIDVADTAVRLSPKDAEVHYLRGLILDADGDLPAAIVAYQSASSLRPGDYVLWLTLARAQELNGDNAGAIEAASRAVQLAPSYAQPHWQLGNILVRAGQLEKGFAELRLAGTSDPTLLASNIDLAWQLSNGKIDSVLQAVQPDTPAAYQALAQYFRKRGEVAAAIEMFRNAGRAADTERHAYVAELISARKFSEAYTLWSIAHPPVPNDPNGPLMFDPGFEEESSLDEPGFGWRAPSATPSLTLSLDNSNPQAGRSSLRVDFNGASNAGLPIVSQLVLLQPNQHYQLSFAFRTDQLASVALPIVLVIDPGDNKVLGQTRAFPQTTNGWSSTTVDFKTGPASNAIQISLQREPCGQAMCPIFGHLWLDGFVLKG